MTNAVSENALIGRINRKLAREGEKVRKCRESSRWFYDVGRFYSTNIDRNMITATNVDLESWARELGVLYPGEQLQREIA
jgi:hypothetical protein